MIFEWDPIRIINLILCIIILIYGYKNYKKTKTISPLYIGIGFGLFGISHLATLLGIHGTYIITDLLIIIRTAAYLMVLLAVYNFSKKEKL